MDRFIAGHIIDTSFEGLYLKSNMDRFIVNLGGKNESKNYI